MADKSNGLLPGFHFADDGVIAKTTVPTARLETLERLAGLCHTLEPMLTHPFRPFAFANFAQRPAQGIFTDDLAHSQDLGADAITA